MGACLLVKLNAFYGHLAAIFHILICNLPLNVFCTMKMKNCFISFLLKKEGNFFYKARSMLDYSRLWIQKITHIKTLYLKHFVKKGVISIYRGSLPYVNFITSNAKLFKYLAKYFITYCNFHNWPNIKKKTHY